jgi:hypothetical protein
MNLRVYQSTTSTSNPRLQQGQLNKSSQNYAGNGRTSNFRHRHNHSKGGKCIFCGDASGTHLSRDCAASTCVNGSPCFLQKHPPNNSRRDKNGRFFCFAWNGPNGCQNEKSCQKGEHLCTLCGSSSHNAQLCATI